MDDYTREIVERIEALHQQREERADIDDADPEQRRQQKQQSSRVRDAQRSVRDRAVKHALSRLCRPSPLMRRSSIGVMDDFGHVRRTLSPFQTDAPAGMAAMSEILSNGNPDARNGTLIAES